MARYGGEEFAIILPFSSEPDARKVAERAVRTIAESGIVHEATELTPEVVTISAGYCTLISTGQAGEAQRLRERADKALYEAKRSGRNRAHGET
ncbi:diguanylate cyclase [Pantoea sp. LMR881]|uniref:diguanylate cyclase domain-containing protein n=1 Tax=Pantoea sp. LMR881 TaxID=3014336 RepID=UPI0022AEA913|nr:diguanylate cyclase [Pantoea sp. LMR881]MCZ4060955.1 diguanylate cyclase [Pantoea sp. LMR881]